MLKFECKGLDTLVAARKLADLPKEKPTLDNLVSRAEEFEKTCKDEAEALRVYEQAAKLYPGKAAVLSNLARLLATAEEKDLRNPKRALPLAREAAKLTDEKNVAVLDALAQVLHANGELAEAARYAQLVSEKNPNNEDLAKRAKKYAKDAKKLKQKDTD
ncbi:MAG: hypothetical protein NTW87_06680 [Planctomycetota bacterium]|nr:hypothetical protein [Planctomycetota bacterium]